MKGPAFFRRTRYLDAARPCTFSFGTAAELPRPPAHLCLGQAIVLALVLAFLGCKPGPRSEVVVVLDSTFSVPDEINAIRFDVRDSSGQQQRSEALLFGPTRSALPVTLSLVGEDSRSASVVQLVITGALGATEVFSRRGQLRLAAGQRRVFPIGLFRECLECGPDCTEPACLRFNVSALDLEPFTGELPGVTNPFTGTCLGQGTCARPTARSLSANAEETCLVDPDGQLRCFSGTQNGETRFDRRSLKAVGLGDGFGCAIDDSDNAPGMVVCWGRGEHGQLGNDQTGDRDFPVPVLNDTREVLIEVTALAVGARHACALTDAGAVYCWGDNRRGQVTGEAPATGPEQLARARAVAGLDEVGVIGAGKAHSCAAKRDGTLLCFGDRSDGQSGGGASEIASDGLIEVTFPEPSPAAIEALALGDAHTCALTGNGQVFCWGRNIDGEAGVPGEAGPIILPRRHIGLNSGQHIAAGTSHTCVASSTRLQCWGRGEAGQLGQVVDASSNPVEITLLSNARALGLGAAHTCVAVDRGNVQCFGDNSALPMGREAAAGGTTPISIIDFASPP